MRRLRLAIACLALLALTAIAPHASAHTAVFSADNNVRASVGLLNEPTSTYSVTGLDICFSQNTTAPRPAVAVASAADFQATLKAPGGQSLTAGLVIPFGKPNCLTFEKPIYLTVPGQYYVDFSGTINGTTFAATNVAAGGAVLQRENLTFPDSGLATYTELQHRVVALETLVATLNQQVADLQGDQDGGRFAPGASMALLMVLLAGLAMMRRLR